MRVEKLCKLNWSAHRQKSTCQIPKNNMTGLPL